MASKTSPQKDGASAQSTRAPTPLESGRTTPLISSETPEPMKSPSSTKQAKPPTANLLLDYEKQGAESTGPWITPDPMIPIEKLSIMEFLSSRSRIFQCYWRAPASDNDSNNFLSHIDAWKDLALEYMHEVDAQVEADHPIHTQAEQVIQRLEKAYDDLFATRLPVRHGHDNMYIVATLERVWQSRLQKLPSVPSEHTRYWLRDGYPYYVVDPKKHVGYIDVKCAWAMELNDVKELVHAVVFQDRRHQLSRIMALNAPEGTLWYVHNHVDDRLWAVTAFDPAGRSVTLHQKMGSVEGGIHSFN